MRCTFTSVILLLLASSLALAAPDSPPPSPERFDWDLAGQIAVQAGGRVKPLDSYARELVKS
ncbi:hypothetical protein KJ815_05115, partial [bacterium]|nr:hypothetical protein [bacterium]